MLEYDQILVSSCTNEQKYLNVEFDGSPTLLCALGYQGIIRWKQLLCGFYKSKYLLTLDRELTTEQTITTEL